MKDVRLKKSVSRFTQKLWTTTTSCDAKFAIVGRKMMLRKEGLHEFTSTLPQSLAGLLTVVRYQAEETSRP